MPFSPPVSVIPALTTIPVLAALSIMALAVGRRTLLWFRMPLQDATLVERTVFRAAIGFGLLQYIFFTLAATSTLSPRSLLVALYITAVLCGYDILILGASALKVAGNIFKQRIPPLQIALLIMAIAVLSCRFIFVLCPPTDYDGLFYHLTAPKRYLEHGAFFYLTGLTVSNYPLGWDMLMGICLALVDDTSAKGVHYIAGLLVLIAVYALGVKMSGRRSVGFLSAVLTLPFIQSMMSAAYVDLAHAFYFSASTLAFFRYIDKRNPRDLFLCAALTGFTACVKLSGLCAPVLFAVLTVFALRQRETPWLSICRTVILFLVTGFVPVVPWLLKTWVLTGNPIYPMLSQLFPTPDWYPLLREEFLMYHQKFVWGRNMNWSEATRSALLLAAAVVIVVSTSILAFGTKKNDIQRYAILTLGVFLLVTVSSTGFYRRYLLYLLPLAIPMLLAAIVHRPVYLRGVAVTAFCLCAVSLVEISRGFKEAVSTGLGITSRRDYLKNNLSDLPVWDAVNALPPSAKILSLADRTYYSDRFCYAAAPLLQGRYRFDGYDNFVRDVVRDEITHVVIPTVGTDVEVSNHFTVSRNGATFPERLVTERGVLLVRTEQYSLYELRPVTVESQD